MTRQYKLFIQDIPDAINDIEEFIGSEELQYFEFSKFYIKKKNEKYL